MYFATLNNCDELIDFMINELTDYPFSEIMFQGDILRIVRTDRQYPIYTMDIDRGSIFVSEREVDSLFYLQLIEDDIIPMSALTIMVPNYVKEELIATLKGEW